MYHYPELDDVLRVIKSIDFDDLLRRHVEETKPKQEKQNDRVVTRIGLAGIVTIEG